MKKTAIVPLWWNGRLRNFRVKEGKDLTLHWSEPTDEGYTYLSELLYLEHGIVYRESSSGGCDCDGPIDRYYEYTCPVEKLHALPVGPGMCTPAWEDIDAYQVDAFAVAAGY